MSQSTNTGGSSAGLASPTGLASGLGGQGLREVIAIIAVAVIVIGGGEFLLRLFEVPQYILPAPSAIGASVGLVLAAVITQFPFVEKVITPYILLLVTTPMLALVPLLILNFGFGYAPRIIAVALASGPMVMINAATGFRRVDTMKIALARSCGANTLQIFTKIRIPMAMPMVIVGLMIGAIFGMITAVGADMSGGGFGLGSRLTTYSSTLRMPEFFACILILAVTGITIYAFFFWLGKKLAGWES